MVTAINTTQSLQETILRLSQKFDNNGVNLKPSDVVDKSKDGESTKELTNLRADIKNIYVGRDGLPHVSKSGFAAGQGIFGWLGKIIYGTKQTGAEALKEGLNIILSGENSIVDKALARICDQNSGDTHLEGLVFNSVFDHVKGDHAASAKQDLDVLLNPENKNKNASEGIEKLKNFVNQNTLFVTAFANQMIRVGSEGADPRGMIGHLLLKLADNPDKFGVEDFQKLHRDDSNSYKQKTIPVGVELQMKLFIEASQRADGGV